RHGPNASLRSIADDANVNLGLIHRHFGNKDDLLRAVLRMHAEAGRQSATTAPDLATAVTTIANHAEPLLDYLRVVAGLFLAEVPLSQVQADFPTMDALRSRATDDAEEIRLLVSMALTYGWAVFGEQLLQIFERAERRADVQAVVTETIANLLA
ncbi:MAG TPA: helix-turn-helix domain-containing protein, partial [Ilumatobacteraceae bacterium]|nr:helix-turn-helix domain-containing protein [Ilumatobacteraceae bacterium]